MRGFLALLLAGSLIACNGSNSAPPPSGGTAPTVTSVAPAAAFNVGGPTLTVEGTGFAAGVTAVTVSGVAATDLVVVDDTTLTVTLPASAAFGAAEVAVTGAGGTGRLPGAFTYVRFAPVPGTPDQRLDSGGTGEFFPQICCSGARVYVVWADDPNGNGNRDMFLRVSEDRGATWSNDVRLNTNAAGASNSVRPRICCDGARVYVVWTDNRNGTFEPFVNRSLDGGATFLPSDVRVTSTAPGSANVLFTPEICCAGATVSISWSDDRNAAVAFGGADLFANTSTDGGLTWQGTDARLNPTATAGATPFDASLSTTRMCCSGSTILSVWSDGRDGDGDVWVQRSANGGATWLPAAIRLDSGGTSHARYPRICCDGLNVHVGFVDDRDAAAPEGAFDVYVASSADGGATWANDVRVSTAAPGLITAGNIELCCQRDAVYLTWRDNRNGNFGEDIFFNRSTDNGATFGTDTRLNTGVAPSSAPRSALPKICCGDGAIYVVWGDERNGDSDLFFNASRDGGATWLATDVRLDTGTPGAADSLFVQSCCDGPFAYFVWRDHRNGDPDLFFNRIVP